jgi:hypothetical protein
MFHPQRFQALAHFVFGQPGHSPKQLGPKSNPARKYAGQLRADYSILLLVNTFSANAYGQTRMVFISA